MRGLCGLARKPEPFTTTAPRGRRGTLGLIKAPVAHDGYGKVAIGLLRWAAVPATILLLCLLPNAFMYCGRHSEKEDRARLDLRNLQQALTTYRQHTGAWPSEAHWVEALVHAQLLTQEPLDPWQRSYRYQLESLDAGERPPVLTCLGRDGELGTGDDLSAREPALKPR